MKKNILCLLLTISMLLSVFVVANAAETTTQSVTINYGLDESFVVNIPADISFSNNNTARINLSLTDVNVAPGNSVNVSITGTSFDNGAWYMANTVKDSLKIPYVISSMGGAVVGSGDCVIVHDYNDAMYSDSVSTYLDLGIVGQIPGAGSYKDILTFTTYIDETGGAGFYRYDVLASSWENSGIKMDGFNDPYSMENDENSAYNVVQRYGTTKIVVPANTTVGDFSLAYIPGVHTVEILEGITTIGSNAFFEADYLKNVIIPGTVTTIEGSAFYGSGIESITIPNGVTTIEGNAFADTSLREVYIPETVTKIGGYAFYNTPMETIYYSGSQSQWNSIVKGEDWDMAATTFNVVFAK